MAHLYLEIASELGFAYLIFLFSPWKATYKVYPMSLSNAIALMLTSMLLAGCASNPDIGYYRAHRRALMREVVHCENNGGVLANTPPCQAALRVNAQLF